MKQLSLLVIFAFIGTSVISQDLMLGFSLNEYSVSKYSDSLLKHKLTDLQLCDSLIIIGHTDTVGSIQYNTMLSRNRAESIKEWLISNNVKPVIIKVFWKGESEILDNKSNDINRRAEIFIFKSKVKVVSLQDQTFSKESQVFIIDNNRDTTVFGKEGTFISFPRNSINSTKSSYNKKFEVSLTEFYTLSDIVLSHLTTRTDEKILETKGMINLQIGKDLQKCSINRNEPIKVGFPNADKSEYEMSLFNGKPNQDGEVIWEEAQNARDFYEDEFVFVEEMPMFLGGESERIKFLSQNINYPQQAMEKGIEGTVYISFLIDSAGRITNRNILRGIGGGCDEEVLRIIDLMPLWIPGKQNGKNIAVLYTMPVSFRLNGNGQFDRNQVGNVSRAYTSINDSTFDKAKVISVNNYIFDVLSLGWINCDRYIYEKSLKVNMIVSLKAKGDISTFIIFTKSKSVLNGIFKNGYYIFNQIPKNEEIVLIGIHKMNGKTYFAQKNIKVLGSAESLDNFEEITFKELNYRINGIGKKL